MPEHEARQTSHEHIVEQIKNPETEAREVRANFMQVAKDFLMDDGTHVQYENMTDDELRDYVQDKFQENLTNFFESSGLSEEVARCGDDEDAVHFIAAKSVGVHGWVDMLPNLIRSNPGAGMNCTMASAMLHLSLEKLGYNDVHTAWVKGHHAVLRELGDGSLKLYDATSLSTKDGKLVGYSYIFRPEQVRRRIETGEEQQGSGQEVILSRGERDSVGGFAAPDEHGNFTKLFYTYDPSIKMDIEIALGNLSEVKDDAREVGGVEDLPVLDDEYLRAVANFLKGNNLRILSDADVVSIGRSNPDAVRQLTMAAESCVIDKRGAMPNPYDFLQSNLIQPRDRTLQPPDPNTFTEGAKERHVQAQRLCAEYPELENLDIEKVRRQFKLPHHTSYTE
jgi:hypothetical protein